MGDAAGCVGDAGKYVNKSLDQAILIFAIGVSMESCQSLYA